MSLHARFVLEHLPIQLHELVILAGLLYFLCLDLLPNAAASGFHELNGCSSTFLSETCFVKVPSRNPLATQPNFIESRLIPFLGKAKPL